MTDCFIVAWCPNTTGMTHIKSAVVIVRAVVVVVVVVSAAALPDTQHSTVRLTQFLSLTFSPNSLNSCVRSFGNFHPSQTASELEHVRS